ncbi:MAG: 2-C-methyl-D-erythritol 2,4-cyclodiphosphate synthase [Oscillospiraceae bacterium]|jgi:2-C-methyl-D-erythritol 2,4-cyclodiphosphate synthase|nr:2-C-methyl-D-erythritol 2,4-cyclodiphosphate synthase [Oscillospiraceae bacterium]
MRIGYGYDVHRLKEGRECVLCGVHIPYGYGPDGHSDADVPVHALIDAILGAAAKGDIGARFPDGGDAWRGANSLELLQIAWSETAAMGYALGNADITIIMQKPKLLPYIGQMRANISDALGVPPGRVSVKATTEEGLGFTGGGQGVASSAVVLLEEMQK